MSTRRGHLDMRRRFAERRKQAAAGARNSPLARRDINKAFADETISDGNTLKQLATEISYSSDGGTLATLGGATLGSDVSSSDDDESDSSSGELDSLAPAALEKENSGKQRRAKLQRSSPALGKMQSQVALLRAQQQLQGVLSPNKKRKMRSSVEGSKSSSKDAADLRALCSYCGLTYYLAQQDEHFRSIEHWKECHVEIDRLRQELIGLEAIRDKTQKYPKAGRVHAETVDWTIKKIPQWLVDPAEKKWSPPFETLGHACRMSLKYREKDGNAWLYVSFGDLTDNIVCNFRVQARVEEQWVDVFTKSVTVLARPGDWSAGYGAALSRMADLKTLKSLELRVTFNRLIPSLVTQ